jgi:hypothetical protein
LLYRKSLCNMLYLIFTSINCVKRSFPYVFVGEGLRGLVSYTWCYSVSKWVVIGIRTECNFGRLGLFAISPIRFMSAQQSARPSVRISTRISAASSVWLYVKVSIGKFYEICSDIQNVVKIDKKCGHFTFRAVRVSYFRQRSPFRLLHSCTPNSLSVRPTLYPHVAMRLPMYGYTWNLVLGIFMISVQTLKIWLK